MGRQRRTNGGSGVGRRDFLKMGVASAALAGMSGIAGSGTAAAASRSSLRASARMGAKGVLPGLVQAGPELALPPGFSYKTFGSFGSAMSDGFVTPPIHDGMGVFAEPGGGYRIVRNHELGDSNDVPGGSVVGDPVTAWDKGAPGLRDRARGRRQREPARALRRAERDGLELLGRRDPVGDLADLRGDHRRPRQRMEEAARLRLRDGSRSPAVPSSASRSRRWAASCTRPRAVDPETSVVFLTEDNNPDGFYRYVPDDPGELAKGGVLQALRIKGQPGYNTVIGQTVGEVLPVDWVKIDDPDPADAADNPRAILRQARAKGAARFMSGEGATWRGDSVVFDSSDGGDYGRGQIWEYTPTTRRGKRNERGRARAAVRVDGQGRPGLPGQPLHEPRRRDRARRGRRRPAELRPRDCFPTTRR